MERFVYLAGVAAVSALSPAAIWLAVEIAVAFFAACSVIRCQIRCARWNQYVLRWQYFPAVFMVTWIGLMFHRNNGWAACKSPFGMWVWRGIGDWDVYCNGSLVVE